MKHILPILIILISTDCYSQFFGERFVSNPTKRVVNIVYLESNDLSVPDFINDSTTRKIYEKRFIYSNNKVSKIETKWFQDNYRITTDSIIYKTIDSVIVFGLNRNRLLTYSQKLYHFNEVYNKINEFETNDSTFKVPILSLTFRIKNGLIKEINLTENKRNWKSIIMYDKKDMIVEFIIENSNTKGASWNSIRYLNDKDFELLSGSGKMWCCSEIYYFDKDSYLIKKISDSDTNPHIMIFEYENGMGNASDFTYNLTDFLTLKPMVY